MTVVISSSAIVSSDVIAEILARAADSPDHEVCGLLLGRPDEIVQAVATTNVARSPADSFEIDPAALLSAHRSARAGGPAVVGHYHSHPDGACEPSPRDAAAAVAGQLWMIVAAGEAALFRADASGGFTRCEMINGGGAGCGSAPHSPEGPPRGMVKVGTEA